MAGSRILLPLTTGGRGGDGRRGGEEVKRRGRGGEEGGNRRGRGERRKGGERRRGERSGEED